MSESRSCSFTSFEPLMGWYADGEGLRRGCAPAGETADEPEYDIRGAITPISAV